MNPTQSFGSGERDGNGTAFAQKSPAWTTPLQPDARCENIWGVENQKGIFSSSLPNLY